MGTMQVARINFLGKNNALSSVARSASCSRGWLRMVVQTIFAVITVTSFILIVMMSLKLSLSPGNKPRPPVSRCHVNNCRVMCREAPFFGKYENDVTNAVSEAETKCKRVSLLLNTPAFVNSTLSVKWLPEMWSNIHEFSIFRGNLMHIPSEAFMSQFARNIQIIEFKSITIRTLGVDSLVGLSSLKEFHIKHCNFIGVQANALGAVDNTLETLSITKSENWNPINITGMTNFAKLVIVDFSSNNFKDVLGSNSFTGLENCKVLYLNSCRITAIGAGAFDHLHNIDVIYLNNNFLVTVPPGLFSVIIAVEPRPRINLQNNSWQCDCSSKDLRLLVANDVLLVEPVCYNPSEVRDKSFSEFITHCDSKLNAHDSFGLDTYFNNIKAEDYSDYVQINGTCYNNNSAYKNISLRLFSPVHIYKCPLNSVKDIEIMFPLNVDDNAVLTGNSWLKLTFFLKSEKYSVVQIDSSAAKGYGLLWYQSTCPYEIYCADILPNYFRVYNVDLTARYTFCPINLRTGLVEVENCISYNVKSMENDIMYTDFHALLYISTGLGCLFFGALCVYILIRANPSLLKGSKRILFVKHKMIDALVLPPKIPLRNDLVNDSAPIINNNKIFIVSTDNKLSPTRFSTQKSVRSNKSSNPSYISALQPTEDQLAEWRIRHHFNNDLTLTSMNSNLSVFSWVSAGSSPYHSDDANSDRIYESLK